MADPAQSTETTEKRTELFNKTAAASQKYALKQYADAADLYSEATALQAELNGELDPKNADLLYAYGRCLYHLGVTKSDVLGGQVAGEGSGDKASGKKRKRDADAGEGDASTSGEVAEKVVKKAVESKDGMKVGNDQERAEESSKPFIQITGDTDDWEDDDEEDGEGADGADGEDEEDAENDDDFATAYEILDIARILLVKQAEAIATAGTGKGKAGDEVKHIRERLADTHDLQAEISLENERFADAISDSRASLELKQEIYPTESSIVAEAHFKLSLALEFASVTAPKDADGRVEPGKEGKVDEDMRKDAANHMELAIESSRLRVAEESTKLASLGFEESERKKMEIADVQEMISDMEQRLEDLRNPAVSINNKSGPADAPDNSNPLGGILGDMLGETPATRKTRLDEAMKGATDLTGLVKHRKPGAESKPKDAPSSNGSSKRKAESSQDGTASEAAKRAKVEQTKL